ncbi:MAG: hypothetical protein B6A08_18610 [Sorangiineae bacterium NIC37A_2]|nr:MAG: hypothetical protein B6A08_18610 [Sorangiineae bacterium NIC37A_2]
MNPLIVEGTRLMAPTLIAAAKSIPTAQLAKFGLLRGPLVGFGPVALAFLGGAAVTALAVPASRQWISEQATRALGALSEKNGAPPRSEERAVLEET